MYFIVTDNWRLNIERVKLRVKQGGHDVDDKKIEDRYYRSLKLFKQAAAITNDAFLIDNSKDFNLLAEARNGRAITVSDDYPDWLRKYYNPESV